jgi:hypothetical protein
MKTNAKRFQEAVLMFPKLTPLLSRLDNAGIPYVIGGSLSLYIQGNDRIPKDVDIMFTDEAFERANEVFDLKPQSIDRPYNRMNKSSPTNDDSVDFLNRYTSKALGKEYYSPPTEWVDVEFNNQNIHLVPAEKVAVFKLIARREHYNDLDDFNELFQHLDFDKSIFWRIVDSLNAREVVANLLNS